MEGVCGRSGMTRASAGKLSLSRWDVFAWQLSPRITVTWPCGWQGVAARLEVLHKVMFNRQTMGSVAMTHQVSDSCSSKDVHQSSLKFFNGWVINLLLLYCKLWQGSGLSEILCFYADRQKEEPLSVWRAFQTSHEWHVPCSYSALGSCSTQSKVRRVLYAKTNTYHPSLPPAEPGNHWNPLWLKQKCCSQPYNRPTNMGTGVKRYPYCENGVCFYLPNVSNNPEPSAPDSTQRQEGCWLRTGTTSIHFLLGGNCCISLAAPFSSPSFRKVFEICWKLLGIQRQHPLFIIGLVSGRLSLGHRWLSN